MFGESVFTLKALLGMVVAGISYLFGGFDMLLQTLIVCMCLDYLTGVAAAIYLKKLNSEVGFKGILKKFIILTIVALATCIEHITGTTLIRTVVISFYIANEGISILENAGRMDIPIVKNLKNILEQLKNDSNKKE